MSTTIEYHHDTRQAYPVIQVAPITSLEDHHHPLKPSYSSSEELTVKAVETEDERTMALSDYNRVVFHHESNSHLVSLAEHSDTSTSGEYDAGLDIDGSHSGECEVHIEEQIGHAAIDESNSEDLATIPALTGKRIEPPLDSESPSSDQVPKTVSNTPANSTGSSPNKTRPVSILKPETKAEPRYVNNHRRCWRSLPQADLDSILLQAASHDEAQTSAPPHHARSHSVGFDSIQIRFYAQTVGDNPSCSYGTPIQLDWNYEECDGVAVNDYENTRGKRRNLRQMVLSYYHRRNILSWQYGVPEDELKQAQKQADKIKLKRTITRTFLPVMPIESVMEKASRRAKQLVKSKH